MINKSRLSNFRLSLLAVTTFALPIATPSAAALVSIGDHANLFFNGSATVRANDNIFLDSENEESDVIFILAPGLELNVGSRGTANLNIYYREDFHLYNDNSQLDDNYSNIFVEGNWDEARLELRLNGSYQQLAQPTSDQIVIPGQLVERDQYRANLRGEYDIGERTSASAGVESTFLRYDTRGFVDRDTFAIPVNFYYALTPLVDVSVGYRFRHTDNDQREPITLDQFGNPTFGAPQDVSNYRDHYFNVGARGELAPKLIGEARVGYQEREVSGADRDQSSMSFSVDLSHFTTARTTLTAGAFRDFGTGGRGEGTTSTGGSLGVRHSFSHLLSGQAGVTYTEREWNREVGEFGGREDELLDLNLGLTYSPNVYLDFTGGYVFRTNNSNVDRVDFDNNIFSLSASLRY